MKIEVNIEKKHLFMLFTAISIVALCAVAYAYNSNPAVPSNFGHSADEVMVFLTNGSQMSVQNILKNGLFGSCYVDYSNNITLTGSVAAGNYRNKDCPDGYIVTGAYIGGDNAGGGEVELADLHCSRLVCGSSNGGNSISSTSGSILGEYNVTYTYTSPTIFTQTHTLVWGTCVGAAHNISLTRTTTSVCTPCNHNGCTQTCGERPSNAAILCVK